MSAELRELMAHYSNFNYRPCLSGDDVPAGYVSGRAHDIAFEQIPSLKNWRMFLCRHPEMVRSTKRKAFLAGAAMKNIYADAFNVSQPL